MERFEIDAGELPGEWSRGGLLAGYFTACAVMVALMHLWHYVQGWDPLAFPIIHSDVISIDLWSFVHVTIYIGVGALFPNNWMVPFLGGCLFEVLEGTISAGDLLGTRDFWEERGVNS
eukprot:Sspe_Gene.117772::Locus_109695_Transcript_1_2_Confidence_0.600_Length_419::g.117772::m.117772